MESDNLSLDDRLCLDVFHKHFVTLRDKSILLYGLGKTTKLLLDHITDYNIIGLMDRANISDTAFGQKVFTVAEASEMAEIIVIVASPYAQQQIFPRISHLRDNGIRIFGVAGNEWTDLEEINYDYPKETLAQLCEKIDRHDVISFDIFDTLIMRKCHLPQLIFDENVRKERVECQALLAVEKQGLYTLDDIYTLLAEKLNWTQEQSNEYKNREIESELANCIPRSSMVEAFNYALSNSKEVLLVTDMYLPELVIRKLLEKCNIYGGTMYVSCVYGATKRHGGLWDTILTEISKSPEQILHIGDDPDADFATCHERGIHTFSIYHPARLLESSALRSMSVKACTTDDLLALGLVGARLFDDPFVLVNTEGTPVIDNAKDIGYVFFGSLVLGYLLWVLEITKKDNVKNLCFISRDGYVWEKCYNIIQKQIPEFCTHIQGCVYLYTSRRISGLANLKNKYDIEQMVRVFDFKGNLQQLMKHLFNVDIEDSSEALRPLNHWDGDKLVLYIINNYAKAIYKAAEDIHVRYTNYLTSIKMDGSMAMLDLRSSGTNLHNLIQLTGWDIHGYAVLRRNVKSEHFKSEDLVTPYIKDNGTSFLGQYNITTACDMAECIFTSPDGMLLDFDMEGNPVFEGITNAHRDIEMFHKVWEGITCFIDDFFSIRSNKDDVRITPEFADSLFGTLQNKQVKINSLFPIFEYYEYLRNEFRTIFT